MAVALTACGGGSSGSDPKSDPEPTLTDPLNLTVDSLGTITTVANTPVTVSGVVQVPAESQNLTGLQLDIQETLNQATITVPAPARAAQRFQPQAVVTGTLELRFDFPENLSTVCQTGELFGPFALTIDDTATPPVTVSPTFADAGPPTVGFFNSGQVAVCLSVTTSDNLEFQIPRVVSLSSACTTTPADMNGTWAGEYTCQNAGSDCANPEIGVPSVETGDVSLDIVQPASGYYATYTDDGGANYIGYVCGSKFTFGGGLPPDYLENGVFTLDSATTASKTSDWRGVFYACGGSCEDPNLVKQ